MAKNLKYELLDEDQLRDFLESLESKDTKPCEVVCSLCRIFEDYLKYSQTCLSGHLSIAANLPIVTTKLIPMEAHYLYKNLYIFLAATCL